MTSRPANVVPIRRPPEPDLASRDLKRTTRRSFGTVRKQRSGRFQASYLGEDNERHFAPVTFDTKADAGAWLDMRHAELLEYRWKPPAPVTPNDVVFSDYAADWLADRELSPRTRAEYQRMLDARLSWFAEMYLDEITPSTVKAWWSAQGSEHPTARRKAYDLLHTILDTATRPDEDTNAPPLLEVNPARLSTKTLRATPKKASTVKPATLAELHTIMDAMPARYAAMVALAAWCAPRFGELTELRRKDMTIEHDEQGEPVAGVLHITRAVVWTDPDTPVIKGPKSDAGVRDVAIPPHILPVIETHMGKWAAPGPDGLLFPAVESGGHMKHGALYKVFRRARKEAGRPDLRWHDLRHTGATMAAQAGATLAELMARLGHSDVRAALIYQHAAEDRDKAIADALSRMAARS